MLWMSHLCSRDHCMIDATYIFDTPVGPLLARARDGQLIQLSFCDPRAGADPSDSHVDVRNVQVLKAVQAQIGEYFSRRRTRFELPLNWYGPTFHRRVWAALCEIPYGQTVSYGNLASQLGVAGSACAVGTANGANPIAIVVPCHRVIGSDGRLVGYGGGLKRKRTLLDLESGSLQLAL